MTALGQQVAVPASPDENTLEVIPNPLVHGKKALITIDMDYAEFTCLCPVTGHPDFGKITIEYEPYRFCVESKSLKLYLASYRNLKSFHEVVVGQIALDFIKVVKPLSLHIKGLFNPRGGLKLEPELWWDKEDKA